MKKLMLSLCLCVFVVSLCSAADDPVAQLNAIASKSKNEYAKLAKEIDRLKTGNRLGAASDIARAEKKQQEIVEKIKAVKSEDNLPALQLQARILAEIEKGKELMPREADIINGRVERTFTIKQNSKK